jgi:hypothetical protein
MGWHFALTLFVLCQDPVPEPVRPSPAFLDFDRLEAGLRFGCIRFGADFEADPEPAAGAVVRIPSPWLSRGVFGLESDDVALFLDFTGSRLERDADQVAEDPDATIHFAGLGVDWTFARSETLSASAHVGLQYGWFGGVDDTEDGVAFLAGLAGSVRFSDAVRVSLSPQASVADAGDRLYFLHLGLHLEF